MTIQYRVSKRDILRNTLLSILLSVSHYCFAQTDDPEELPSKSYELRVKTVAPVSFQLPFQEIKIIDSRFDTSKLGFLFRNGLSVRINRSFQKVKLKPGVQRGIENFYNEYYLYKN